MKVEKQAQQTNRNSRRDFLRKSVALSAGVATVVVVPSQVLASVDKKIPVVESNKEEGYRLTKHIADYYKSTQL